MTDNPDQTNRPYTSTIYRIYNDKNQESIFIHQRFHELISAGESGLLDSKFTPQSQQRHPIR